MTATAIHCLVQFLTCRSASQGSTALKAEGEALVIVIKTQERLLLEMTTR